MKNNTFKRYFLFVCIGLLIASFYPLLMGVRVITDMIFNSTVMKEAYPKYIIPYTPLSIALIVGVAAMPILLKRLPRLALLLASATAVAVFFAVEVLFEQKSWSPPQVMHSFWRTGRCICATCHWKTSPIKR